MKRLRHPIRAIREPFGTAGLIVAMIALVAALGGTALAAAKLNSTQKKEVEKIAKKFAGKTGSAGSQGPAGPAGAKGDTGTNGKDGTNGTNGTNGKEGPEGKQGKEGTTGFTATLPSGETETGSEGFGDGDWQISAGDQLLEGFDPFLSPPFRVTFRSRAHRGARGSPCFSLESAPSGRLTCHLAPPAGAVTAARAPRGTPQGLTAPAGGASSGFSQADSRSSFR